MDVNKTRRQILSSLRTRSEPVSGQELADSLGMSRVAVWKHISSLKEKGYKIESTPKGYILKEDGDFLYPWEFPEGVRVFWEHESLSTMDTARNLADSKDIYDIVVSDVQKKGRGRYGHNWISTRGSIAVTFLLATSMPVKDVWRILFASAIALCDELARDNIETDIKWPNDIYKDGKKIAGILLDVSAEYLMVNRIRIGIGINTGERPPLPSAGSIRLKRKRANFISSVFFRLKELIEDSSLNMAELLRSKSKIWGKVVEVKSYGKKMRGIAKDIGTNGELILETENKKTIAISDGICVFE